VGKEISCRHDFFGHTFLSTDFFGMAKKTAEARPDVLLLCLST
jgi:hypothetical protein